jgi:hypothetical protein
MSGNTTIEEKGDMMRISTAPRMSSGIAFAGLGVIFFAVGVWTLSHANSESGIEILQAGVAMLLCPPLLYMGAGVATNRHALTASPESVLVTHGRIPLWNTPASVAVPTAGIVALETASNQLIARLDDGSRVALLACDHGQTLTTFKEGLERYLSQLEGA